MELIRKLGINEEKRSMGLYRCECGREVTAQVYHVKTGHTSSCGCKVKTHGGSYSRLYKTWKAMVYRCIKPTDKNYPKYGGKGVKVCQEWLSFIGFRTWAESAGYNDDLTIDRIDSNGDYSPDNCRWADYTIQNRNRSQVVLSEFTVREAKKLRESGKKYKEIAEIFGVKKGTVYAAINGLSWAEIQ